MIEFQSSERFDQWLVSLSDIKGKARILARLRSASFGHFGDVSHVGAGVYEIRIHFGPGYRVYYKRVGREVYFLLGGGDKSSQKRDISAAISLASSLGEDQKDWQ